MKYLGKFQDKFVNVRESRGLLNSFVSDSAVDSIRDVVADAAVKQHRLLTDQ